MRQAAHISTNAASIGDGFTRVDMASVYCVGCHAPGGLDCDLLCFHCRRIPRSQTVERQNEAQILLTVLALLWAIIALGVGVVWVVQGAK